MVEFKAVPTITSSNSNVRATGSRVRAVGAFVPGLTRKSFEKYGFSTATLLTEWSIIAGPELAAFTLPERLKWPRNVEAYEEIEASEKGRPGATLVLRVDGPRAIDVQYEAPQIIERINAHFGYRAVAEIRFIQAPLPNRHTPRRPVAMPAEIASQKSANDETAVGGPTSDIAAALARLEANIARERRTRRTDNTRW